MIQEATAMVQVTGIKDLNQSRGFRSGEDVRSLQRKNQSNLTIAQVGWAWQSDR